MAGKFKVEEGVRATVDGKSGEVLGTYDEGVRFRFDDGTTTLVKEGDIAKYEEPKAEQAEQAPADDNAEEGRG